MPSPLTRAKKIFSGPAGVRRPAASRIHSRRAALDPFGPGWPLQAIRRERPNLLLLDVQMPEADGFQLLAALSEEETPAVIFVTAYDTHALRAFEVRALDYLLKPFSDERFDLALERVRRQLREHGLAELARRVHGLVRGGRDEGLPAVPPAEAGPQRLLVPGVGRTLIVQVAEIDWIEAEDYYVRLHVGERSHLLRRPLADLEAELDPERFVRVHRSAIVNVDRVRQIRPLFKGDAVLDLEGGRKIRPSRTYRERFLEALGRRQAAIEDARGTWGDPGRCPGLRSRAPLGRPDCGRPLEPRALPWATLLRPFGP